MTPRRLFPRNACACDADERSTAERSADRKAADARAGADTRDDLRARDVAFAYGRNKPILERVCADIVPGSFLAVLGVNGCGKSTLLGCLDGMIAPARGTVELSGKALASYPRDERAKKIALVAQHSHANRLTVFDALLLGRKPYVKSAPNDADVAAVERVVEELNLRNLALRYVDELSGGEYQKVIIGRALVQETDVLLLDEPTNNLDMANQAEVMSLIRSIVDERGIAAAAVMHDLNLSLRYCDRFLMVKDGLVAAYGGVEAITPENIENVYGLKAEIIEHRGRRIVVPAE